MGRLVAWRLAAGQSRLGLSCDKALNICHQIGRLTAQRSRKLEDDVDCGLMYASLNEADVVPLHIRFQRQLLLRQSCLLPPFAENLAECHPCVQTVPPLYEVALSIHGRARSSQHTVNSWRCMASFGLGSGALLAGPSGYRRSSRGRNVDVEEQLRTSPVLCRLRLLSGSVPVSGKQEWPARREEDHAEARQPCKAIP